MTARGRLYYQFFKNKDGSLKEEDQIKAKLIDSITIQETENDDLPNKIYFLTYELDNGVSFQIDFNSDGLVITRNFKDDVDGEQNIVLFDSSTMITTDSLEIESLISDSHHLIITKTLNME